MISSLLRSLSRGIIGTMSLSLASNADSTSLLCCCCCNVFAWTLAPDSSVLVAISNIVWWGYLANLSGVCVQLETTNRRSGSGFR